MQTPRRQPWRFAFPAAATSAKTMRMIRLGVNKIKTEVPMRMIFARVWKHTKPVRELVSFLNVICSHWTVIVSAVGGLLTGVLAHFQDVPSAAIVPIVVVVFAGAIWAINGIRASRLLPTKHARSCSIAGLTNPSRRDFFVGKWKLGCNEKDVREFIAKLYLDGSAEREDPDGRHAGKGNWEYAFPDARIKWTDNGDEWVDVIRYHPDDATIKIAFRNEQFHNTSFAKKLDV